MLDIKVIIISSSSSGIVSLIFALFAISMAVDIWKIKQLLAAVGGIEKHITLQAK